MIASSGRYPKKQDGHYLELKLGPMPVDSFALAMSYTVGYGVVLTVRVTNVFTSISLSHELVLCRIELY